jgi:integrase/recombinase XerD
MIGRQAKILSNTELNLLLSFADRTRHPLRNRVIILLSAKAGLRACEIAGLTWPMVLGPSGQVSTTLQIRDAIAKKRSGRVVPMHPALRQALIALRRATAAGDSVVQSERGGRMTAASIVVWFHRAFRAIGLDGCSSHSGRRSFITRAARLVHKTGGSLRDVQLMAGHQSITTTQGYIQGYDAAQQRLVRLI